MDMALWFIVLGKSNSLNWLSQKVLKIIRDWWTKTEQKDCKINRWKIFGWNYFHLQKLDNFSHVACGCLFLKIRDEDWKFENIRGIFHD